MGMTLTEINGRAYEIIECLYEDSPCFEAFIDSGKNDDWLEFETKSPKTDWLYITSGCYRGVLVIDDFDWVIKFDFVDDPESASQREVNFFEDAENDGFEEYFAKCWKGGTFHNIDFYLMEKALVDENKIASDVSSGVYESDARFHNSGMRCDDATVIVNLFSAYYPLEKVFKLLEFCDGMGLHDIHEGNVGYLGDHPVIIDYAGCY